MKLKLSLLSLLIFFFISGYCQKITVSDSGNNHQINNNITLLLVTFFFTLGFLYLTLFLFYKTKKENLLYSVFVSLLGILFILFNPKITNTQIDYIPICLTLIFFTLYILLYYLFIEHISKFFKFLIIFSIVVLFLVVIKINFYEIISFSYLITTMIASFSIVIKAIIKKKEGAWIIGIGVITFLLLAMSILLLTVIFKYIIPSVVNKSYESSYSGVYIFLLIFLSIVSIPISMAIYLARSFAKTNSNLQLKLIEVENLSAKTIEQEKEKQKILEIQKEILEQKVEERTTEIQQKNTDLKEKNKEIHDSISYAKRIQESILPAREIKYKHFPDAFVLFKPKDIVSGDFYWFCEIEGKKIISAADCTGHGVPGSLMSMIGINALNKIILEWKVTKPDQILNSLHKEVQIVLKQNERNSESRDGMDIAICCLDGNVLKYSGANRPLWLIRNNVVEETKANKFSIGGLQTETERAFTNHTIPIYKGDLIYIFSDGFADQFGMGNKKLMTKKFKELLLSIQQKTMTEQEIFLDNFIENWKGNQDQTDDIIVIGIRI